MNELVQRSDEWLAMRRNFIGSSDAPVVMGVSPWKTPYQLWEEKLGLTEQKAPNSAMLYGINNEEIARKSFEEKTGLLMFPQVIFSDEHDFMMASLDGMDIDGINVVEIKCAGKEDHEKAKSGKAPDHYYPQLQHIISVAKLEYIWYYSFNAGDGILLKIYRDDSYISKLIEKEREFFECIQNFASPALMSGDYQTMRDDMWVTCASDWREVQKQLRSLVKTESELREQLVGMCRGQSSSGGGIRVTRTLQKGRIDYSEIEELKNIDLERYRKQPVEYWRISNHGI